MVGLDSERQAVSSGGESEAKPYPLAESRSKNHHLPT